MKIHVRMIVKIRISHAVPFPSVNEDRARMFLARLLNENMKFLKYLLIKIRHVFFGVNHTNYNRTNIIFFAQCQIIVQDFYILVASFGIIFSIPSDGFAINNSFLFYYFFRFDAVEIDFSNRRFLIQPFFAEKLLVSVERHREIVNVIEGDEIGQDAIFISIYLGKVEMKAIGRETDESIF